MVPFDGDGIIDSFRGPLLFHTFDADYLQRLASGDPAIERHFGLYFSDLLGLKLRVRIRSAQLIEDIRQETLLRVLQIVRTRGVDHPERFGAFVSAVCNNVLMEHLRAESRHDHWDSEPEVTDDSVDLDAPLVNQQRRQQVETVLSELPDKDRDLLRAFFLEDRERGELCRRYGVTEEYLRVLLHRAKGRFRSMYSKRFGASGSVI
jgi:RNA polymerase sigma-70 factor (ECF subfamily)